MVCKKCGNSLACDANFCPSCGQRVVKEKICPSCSKVCGLEDAFCMQCGQKLEGEKAICETPVVDLNPQYEVEIPSRTPVIAHGEAAQSGNVILCGNYIYYLTHGYKIGKNTMLWKTNVHDKLDSICLFDFDKKGVTFAGGKVTDGLFYVNGNIFFYAASQDGGISEYFHSLGENKVFKSTLKDIGYCNLTRDKKSFYRLSHSGDNQNSATLKIADISYAMNDNFTEYTIKFPEIAMSASPLTPLWEDANIYRDNLYIRGYDKEARKYYSLMFPYKNPDKYKLFPNDFMIVGSSTDIRPVFFYKNFVVAKGLKGSNGEVFSVVDTEAMAEVFSTDGSPGRRAYQYNNIVYFPEGFGVAPNIFNLSTLKENTLSEYHKILSGDSSYVCTTPKGIFEYFHGTSGDSYATRIFFLPIADAFASYTPVDADNDETMCQYEFICHEMEKRQLATPL